MASRRNEALCEGIRRGRAHHNMTRLQRPKPATQEKGGSFGLLARKLKFEQLEEYNRPKIAEFFRFPPHLPHSNTAYHLSSTPLLIDDPNQFPTFVPQDFRIAVPDNFDLHRFTRPSLIIHNIVTLIPILLALALPPPLVQKGFVTRP